MTVIVGLGNPGPKFKYTRHNAGFMALDFFAKKNQFPDFVFSQKYQSEISEHENVLLVKPQTFMNESGAAVKSLKLHTESFIVVRDDIDLPLGSIKFSKDSGSGGHKGVDSMIENLGNNHFVQLKIGIATGQEKAQEVVLKKFTKEERELLQGVIEKSAEALDYCLQNGIEKTMNGYN